MLADYHMHTEFSSDSNEPAENMIKKSIESGIKDICITDHYDLDYPHDPDEDDFVFDTDKYFVQLNELKDKYKDKINLHIGVELGLQPHLVEPSDEEAGGAVSSDDPQAGNPLLVCGVDETELLLSLLAVAAHALADFCRKHGGERECDAGDKCEHRAYHQQCDKEDNYLERLP